MPRMEDGTVKRSRFKTLKINELSSVDNPAQPGALAVCFKRDDDDAFDPIVLAGLAKYICEDSGAHTFIEVLQENEFTQKIWPFTDALTQSIRSIVGDKRLSGGEREAQITKSVASFLSKVREISPEAAKQLEGLVSKKECPMAKTVEQLEAELAKAQTDLTAMTERAEKAEGDLKEMTGAKDKAEADCAEAKKALAEASDETLKVDENTEVKKSEVGEAQFKVTKSLLERAELADLAKRADTDYRHVVGKAEEKAKVLQAIDKIADEDTRKAATAILDSAEKMAKGGFDMIGGNRGPSVTEEQSVAKRDYDAEVQKHVAAGMRETEAMAKVRRENPDLFNKMQGERPEAQ